MRGVFSVVAVLAAFVNTVSAAVTGSQSCNKYICVTVRHDNVALQDTYTLAPPEGASIPRSDFGWMSIGFGDSMISSPMIVVWPNSDGTITLSHRIATARRLPAVQSNPPRVAALNTAQTFANASSTQITFTLPSQSGLSVSALNPTSLIWAVSSTNPNSASGSAPFAVHDSAGTMTMALLAPLSGEEAVVTTAIVAATAASNPDPISTPSGGIASESTTGSSYEGTSKTLIAHAVCGGLATMIFLPLGVLIPRISRGFTLNRWWFPAHGLVAGVIGAALIVTTYALAKVGFGDGPDVYSAHPSLGLFVFILILAQVALGVFVHWFKSRPHKLQTKSGRGPSNFLHMTLGITIVVVGWVATWTGMKDEWPIWSRSGDLGVGYTAAWGALVGLFGLAYLAGIVLLLPRQRALEKIAMERRLNGDTAVDTESKSRAHTTELR